MTAHDRSSRLMITHDGSPPSQFLRRIARLWMPVASCMRTATDYYAAALLYEQLSRLSDSELERRGLSRENLARDVVARCDDSGSSSPRFASPPSSPHERFKVCNVFF